MTDGSEEETAPDATGAVPPEERTTIVDLVDPAPSIDDADDVQVSVARGGEVFVFGGLRLMSAATEISREVARTIAHAIEGCRGPAVIVFAGDTFELLRDTRPDPVAALNAHPRLATALSSFLATPERRIVALAGTR